MPFKAVFLLWIFFVICVCPCHTVMSISCSLMITPWERAGLLAFFVNFLFWILINMYFTSTDNSDEMLDIIAINKGMPFLQR